MSNDHKFSFGTFIKKNGPVLAICLVLNVGILGMMWMNYSGKLGGFGDAIVAMENKLLDMRFILRGPVKPSGGIGILAIDEKSIQKFGRWPFTRSVYEKAFANLKKAGAEWIGFDVVWDKPELPLLSDANPELDKLRAGSEKPAEVLKAIDALGQTSLSDQSLIKAIQDYEKIVQGYMYYNTWETDNLAPLKGREFETMDLLQSSVIAAAIMPDGFDLGHYPDLSVGFNFWDKMTDEK
jgi:adenylate cyclase